MDYIFYRIYIFYRKKKDIPVTTGICFVFVVQMILFFLIVVSFNMVTGGLLATKNLGEPLAKALGTLILVVLFIINLGKYGKKEKINRLLEKYKDSPLNQRVKTWQIFLLPVILFLSSFGIFELIKKLGFNSW